MTKDDLATIAGTQPGTREAVIMVGSHAVPVSVVERKGFRVGPGIVEAQTNESPKIDIGALESSEDATTIDGLTNMIATLDGTSLILDAANNQVVLPAPNAYVRRMIKRENLTYVEARADESAGVAETLVFDSVP